MKYFATTSPKTGQERVLVIKLGGLGDVLLALPVLVRLEEHFGQDNVVVLTGEANRSLLAEFLSCKIWATPRGLGILSMLRGLGLRSGRFDTVLDLQGNSQSRYLSWASGPGRKIGLWPGWPYQESSKIPRHTLCHPTTRFAPVLGRIGITDSFAGNARVLPIGGKDLFVRRFLRWHRLNVNEFVLLHPGSSARWVSKRWPASHFIQLARWLVELDITPVWIGDEVDRGICRALAEECGVDACGETSIAELVALGEKALFAVANDSAPMHAIALSGTPVYGLFGPTDRRRSHAVFNEDRTLSCEVSCAPCHQPRCPLRRSVDRCLRELTVQAVIERLKHDFPDLLGEPAQLLGEPR